jgi:hypothetical protein
VPDANEIMGVLLNAQQSMGEMASDDPQVSYMMSAWARICKLMGEHFAPYLPLVMPPVMKAASFKPEITVCECTFKFAVSFTMLSILADEATGDDNDDWQFVNVGANVCFMH